MASLLVLDASALVDLLVGSARGEEVHRRLRAAETLAAPELVTVETASALHRLARAGVLTEADADRGLSALAGLPIRAVPHAAVLEAAWALRHAVRIADAFYLAVAKGLDAPLLTTDARLSRAGVRGVTITLVS